MTSTESGQSRAAMLMHAARRSHFASRIQKYEAKVRQEQKLRTLQREKQKMAMTLIEEHPVNLQGSESPLLLKGHVTIEQVATSPLTQHDIKGMPEHMSNTEHTGFERETCALTQESQRTSSSSGKVIRRRNVAANVLSLAPAGRGHNLEMRQTHHPGAHIALKPSAGLDANINSIAAALNIKIKKADMAAAMQEHAFHCARKCLNTAQKLLCRHTAYTLKKEFDNVYGPAWHCIVGTSFGSYVTHSVGGFIYFNLEKVSVLLFKTTIELVER